MSLPVAGRVAPGWRPRSSREDLSQDLCHTQNPWPRCGAARGRQGEAVGPARPLSYKLRGHRSQAFWVPAGGTIHRTATSAPGAEQYHGPAAQGRSLPTPGRAVPTPPSLTPVLCPFWPISHGEDLGRPLHSPADPMLWRGPDSRSWLHAYRPPCPLHTPLHLIPWDRSSERKASHF